ncbi:DUF1569 domain-containing protein [Fibrella sp. WM1]|uniref:DUF1569 domain-containing protein n=1 Tax=Fibrella musci TaxID=3242485 RepID=UPI00352288FE
MTLTDLSNRIARLTPESQRLWGSMGVGQMMTHCTDQLRIVLGEKDMKLRGSAFTRLLTKWVGLYLPMRLPKNMKTIAELDPNRPLMTQPTGFADDRAALLAALNRLGNVPENHRFAHPVFGLLTKAEAIKLSAIHLDHHLRQFGL